MFWPGVGTWVPFFIASALRFERAGHHPSMMVAIMGRPDEPHGVAVGQGYGNMSPERWDRLRHTRVSLASIVTVGCHLHCIAIGVSICLHSFWNSWGVSSIFPLAFLEPILWIFSPGLLFAPFWALFQVYHAFLLTVAGCMWVVPLTQAQIEGQRRQNGEPEAPPRVQTMSPIVTFCGRIVAVLIHNGLIYGAGVQGNYVLFWIELLFYLVETVRVSRKARRGYVPTIIVPFIGCALLLFVGLVMPSKLLVLIGVVVLMYCIGVISLRLFPSSAVFPLILSASGIAFLGIGLWAERSPMGWLQADAASALPVFSWLAPSFWNSPQGSF